MTTLETSKYKLIDIGNVPSSIDRLKLTEQQHEILLRCVNQDESDSSDTESQIICMPETRTTRRGRVIKKTVHTGFVSQVISCYSS